MVVNNSKMSILLSIVSLLGLTTSVSSFASSSSSPTVSALKYVPNRQKPYPYESINFSQSQYTAQVIVYGATPAGISAAISASDNGKNSVILVEPLLYLGGMGSSGGIGLNDQQLRNLTLITGIARLWCYQNGLHYTPTNTTNCVYHPDNYIGEASFITMLKQANVTLATGCTITGGSRSSTNSLMIESIYSDCTVGGGSSNITFTTTAVMIDASYDGDIVRLVDGISYASGRESNTAFMEPMAGIVWAQDPSEETFSHLYNISAYDDEGNLLPGIEIGTLPEPGSADDRLMAFQHRVCVTTDANNQVAFTAPPDYNRTRYALLQKVLDALVHQGTYPTGPPASYFGLSGPYSPEAGPGKTIVCCGAGAVMSDEPNLNRGWANASIQDRNIMWYNHYEYLAGMLYYLTNDPAVPSSTRASFRTFGLCKDEWSDTTPAHWPPQLYVRVSNRLQGDYILTQRNMLSPQSKPEASVSVALWELDSHITSRWAIPNPLGSEPKYVPFNEGFYRHSPNISVPVNTSCGSANGGCGAQEEWYDVPYEVMLPKFTEAHNLLVPVAISASYVAYTSARIETMFMDLGAAAGVSARLSIASNNTPVQQVPIANIQSILINEYQQRIKGPYWIPPGM